MTRTDFTDIMYTVVATPGEYHVSYAIHKIIGFAQGASGEFDLPVYEGQDGDGYNDSTENIEEAAVFANGDVKWDGCSNWDFDELKRVMIHGCSRSDLTDIGEVLGRCWDMTATLCPHWSAEVATR